MKVFEIIGGSVLLLSAIVLIILVLLQEGKKSGVSALSGMDSQFVGRNRAKSKEMLLAKYTKVLAIVFFGVTLVVWILSIYL